MMAAFVRISDCAKSAGGTEKCDFCDKCCIYKIVPILFGIL